MVCEFSDSFKSIILIVSSQSNLEKFNLDAILWITTKLKHIQRSGTCARLTRTVLHAVADFDIYNAL